MYYRLKAEIFSLVSAAPSLLMLVAACFFVSCGSEHLPSEEEEVQAMNFSPSLSHTRALSGDTRAEGDPTPLTQPFRVWTTLTKSGAQERVMEGYVVKEDGGKWVYDWEGSGQELQYWDQTASKYLFTAVSPKETSGIVSADDDGNLFFSSLSGHIDLDASPAPTDWLYASYERDIKQSHEDTQTVPLDFRHLFAKVVFKVYASAPMTLSAFSVRIPASVDDAIPTAVSSLSLKDFSLEATSSTKTFQTSESGFSLAIDDKPENAKTIAAKFELPQFFPMSGTIRQRTFEISFTDSHSATYSGRIALESDLTALGWEMGKQYIYTLKISGDVILFGVDIESWLWQEGNSYAGTVTNW